MYTDTFSDNSFWGAKKVKLAYTGGTEGTAGDCKDEVDVKVFFDPGNGPYGDHRWYKYWSTGPLPVLGAFNLVWNVPDDDESEAWGMYESEFETMPGPYSTLDCMPSSQSLYLSKRSYNTWWAGKYTGLSGTGKPLFIVSCVVAHELDHMQRRNSVNAEVQLKWDNWWSELSPIQKAGYLTPFGYTALKEKTEEIWGGIDADKDAVRNDLDDYPLSDIDDEILAEEAMGGGYPFDESKDWSKGGYLYDN